MATSKGAWVIRLRELAEELESDFPGDTDAEMAIAKIGNAEAYLRRGCLESAEAEPAAAPAPATTPTDSGPPPQE